MCYGVPVLQLRAFVSHAAVRNYLTSFTCTFLSPLRVTFVVVKDRSKLDEPCVTDSCSICSGSSTGTLYFGSPADLPYVSAFVKTEKMFTHQLACYQTGCHLMTISLSVVTTHLTVSKISHRYRGRPATAEKENILYLCESSQNSPTMYVFMLKITVSLEHAAPIFRVGVTSVYQLYYNVKTVSITDTLWTKCKFIIDGAGGNYNYHRI